MKRHHSKIQEMINPNEVFSLIGLKKHLLDGKDINDFSVKNLDNKIEKKAALKESKVLGKWTAYNICKPVRRPKLILNKGGHTNISNNLFEVTQNIQRQSVNVLEETKIISEFADTEELKTRGEELHMFNNSYASLKIEKNIEHVEIEIDFSLKTQHVVIFSSNIKHFVIDSKILLENFQLPPVISRCDYEEYLSSKKIVDHTTFITKLKGNKFFSIKGYTFVFYLKQWHFAYLTFKKYYREKPFT